jgi:hypothetical protein
MIVSTATNHDKDGEYLKPTEPCGSSPKAKIEVSQARKEHGEKQCGHRAAAALWGEQFGIAEIWRGEIEHGEETTPD